MNIGNWVRRRSSKWHLVESIIEGAAITKCGRRMEERTGDGELQVSDTMPLTRMIGQPQLCRGGCDRPGMVVFNNEDTDTVPEDDGWCGDEDAHLPHERCPGAGSLRYGVPEDDATAGQEDPVVA